MSSPIKVTDEDSAIDNIVSTIAVSASPMHCVTLHSRARNSSDRYDMSRFLFSLLLKKSSLSYLHSVFKLKLTCLLSAFLLFPCVLLLVESDCSYPSKTTSVVP